LERHLVVHLSPQRGPAIRGPEKMPLIEVFFDPPRNNHCQKVGRRSDEHCGGQMDETMAHLRMRLG
jgi:hypothetical protein